MANAGAMSMAQDDDLHRCDWPLVPPYYITLHTEL